MFLNGVIQLVAAEWDWQEGHWDIHLEVSLGTT
jgi:hypothetical protein